MRSRDVEQHLHDLLWHIANDPAGRDLTPHECVMYRAVEEALLTIGFSRVFGEIVDSNYHRRSA